ncbi:MAG: prepilin-type N-terminal cleavage/methylation domain-containing protein [Kofleriaceae bacterium]
MTRARPAQRGFTLIELMVVLAIIGIATGIGAVVMKKEIRTSDVADQIASLSREAARRAITGGRVREDVQLALVSGAARARLLVTSVSANGQRQVQVDVLEEAAPGTPSGTWNAVSSFAIPKAVELVGITTAAVLTDLQPFTTIPATQSVELLFYPDGRAGGAGLTLYLRGNDTTPKRGRLSRAVIMPIGGSATTFPVW